jgi:hypothetical protein
MRVEFCQNKISRDFGSSEGNNYEEQFILGCAALQVS